jgi:hypothetical protein
MFALCPDECEKTKNSKRGGKITDQTLWTDPRLMRLKCHAVALKRGPGRPAPIRLFKAADAVGCMAASAPELPAVGGMAITRRETGLPRPLRSADGCDRWSGTLRKGAPGE